MTDFSLRPDRDLTVLIPARAGSKRVPNKNTRDLGGKPLLQWTIEAARAAKVAEIIVSTDSDQTHWLAHGLNCKVHLRKPEHATDDAADFLWVHDVAPWIETPYFAILRPTSPFRTASTIRRAFAQLVASEAHSIRAVQPVTHPHPAKMWELIPGTKYMRPIIAGSHPDGTPFHSSPTQSLPMVFAQNASLEMASTWVIKGTKTISGYTIAPFFTEALEGFDVNTPEDFAEAERLVPTFVAQSSLK